MQFIWVSMNLKGSSNWENCFYVSYWERDLHFTWSSEPREVLAVCRTKTAPSFLSYLKTMTTSHSAIIKCFTDWASPVAVNYRFAFGWNALFALWGRHKPLSATWKYFYPTPNKIYFACSKILHSTIIFFQLMLFLFVLLYSETFIKRLSS